MLCVREDGSLTLRDSDNGVIAPLLMCVSVLVSDTARSCVVSGENANIVSVLALVCVDVGDVYDDVEGEGVMNDTSLFALCGCESA